MNAIKVCSQCGSDYLRICIFPPSASHDNRGTAIRVECATCHFCGPLPPPDKMTVAAAIAEWNDPSNRAKLL